MLLQLLLTILNRSGELEKKPWDKGNGWLISTAIKPEIFVSKISYSNINTSENISSGITDISLLTKQVYYKDRNASENILAGISDISIAVIKV